MEWLGNVITTANIPAIITLLIAAVVLLWLGKKGLFSFQGKGLKIGNGELERKIIRTQIEWCESDILDMFREIPNQEGMNVYKAKYTLEKVFDELVKMIYLNHITLEPTYVKLKQERVWGVVSSINPEDKWDGLEDLVKSRVEKAIKALYEIRQYYS